jgi:hypothetical protein
LASALLLLSLVDAQSNLWKNRFVKQWQPFGSSDSSIESNNVVAIESNGNFGSQNVGGFSNQPSPSQTNVPSQGGNGVVAPVTENLLTGIQFDCTNKPTGPNKDPNYCDVFHACVYGKQQKTYGCPQVGDRFYYDASTQK